MPDKAHSERLVQVEVINSKQLDIFFRFGKDAPLNLTRCVVIW